MAVVATDFRARANPNAVLVDLALQGGGAHGAFTWGVLDRFLEEDRLQIEGISGTSAGAMNAAVLADGHAAGGARAPGRRCEDFWRRVSDARPVQPVPAQPARRAARALDAGHLARVRRHRPDAARLFSPYDLNPTGGNPLREILAESVDFDAGGARADQAVRHRHQRAHRTRPRVPQRRAHAGRAARVGLPADAVPGGRDRRRGLLGRRLCRQPDHHAAGARVRRRATPILVQINPVERAGTPRSRARHPQPPERGLLQRHPAEGAAHDRRAAAGGQRRRLRGRALGRACASTASPASR